MSWEEHSSPPTLADYKTSRLPNHDFGVGRKEWGGDVGPGTGRGSKEGKKVKYKVGSNDTMIEIYIVFQ